MKPPSPVTDVVAPEKSPAVETSLFDSAGETGSVVEKSPAAADIIPDEKRPAVETSTAVETSPTDEISLAAETENTDVPPKEGPEGKDYYSSAYYA